MPVQPGMAQLQRRLPVAPEGTRTAAAAQQRGARRPAGELWTRKPTRTPERTRPGTGLAAPRRAQALTRLQRGLQRLAATPPMRTAAAARRPPGRPATRPSWRTRRPTPSARGGACAASGRRWPAAPAARATATRATSAPRPAASASRRRTAARRPRRPPTRPPTRRPAAAGSSASPPRAWRRRARGRTARGLPTRRPGRVRAGHAAASRPGSRPRTP
jgi:hypothetical protein